jgi:hypothetical protein
MADKDGRRIFDSENLPLFGTWTGDSETLLSRANVARLPWVSSPVRSIELLTVTYRCGGRGWRPRCGCSPQAAYRRSYLFVLKTGVCWGMPPESEKLRVVRVDCWRALVEGHKATKASM